MNFRVSWDIWKMCSRTRIKSLLINCLWYLWTEVSDYLDDHSSIRHTKSSFGVNWHFEWLRVRHIKLKFFVAHLTWPNSNTMGLKTKRKKVWLTWVFSSFSFWAKTKRKAPWKPKLKVIRLTLLQNGGFDILVILHKVCLFARCLSMKCYVTLQNSGRSNFSLIFSDYQPWTNCVDIGDYFSRRISLKIWFVRVLEN